MPTPALELPRLAESETLSGAEALERFQLLRRLETFSMGATLSLLPAIAIIVAMVYAFIDVAPMPVVLGWAAAQLAQLATFVALDRGIDPDKATLAQLRQHWQRIIALQYLGSTIYAVAFPYLVPYAVALKAILMAIVGTALFCGTLMVHRTAPRAARFHLFALSISLTVTAWLVAGVQSWPTVMLILSFTVALLGLSVRQEQEFIAATTAEFDRMEANATVRMLLHDFEAQSSDWLWTTGPEGNLRDVAVRFAAACGSEFDTLEGTSLIQLFLPGEERDRLARHLIERSPFRDLLVKLRVDGEVRYWRLSARPRDDGRMTGVARDVTHDRLNEERVAFMAHYDNLTGLANRYLFNDRLRQYLGESGERRGDIALFYLDLDDFKSVNDTRGHLVGDRLLREIGIRLEREVRDEDLVARLGGDEFAVLVETRAGMGMLIERAHRFLSVVREPFEIDGHLYRVSTSVGVARCTEGDCDAEELMRRADLALFAAKRKGRDTLAMFEPSLDREARERRELETDLRDAIPRGQLRLHYQPIIALDDGSITGYEALLRWYHPRRGVIGPVNFLDIAEETGLILPIGEWVIRQALAEISRWEGGFRIAINLSPTQVRSPHLVALVAQALHANAIEPDRVEFEITEHVLMQQSETGSDTLARLRELGVRIALDDFGTGYSSLSYLRATPFDRLKIDRKFVVGVEDDANAQAIVSSITRLAEAMGMDTTAEGIENRRQLDLLRRLGCHEAQGFLICEPAPAEAFATPEAVAEAMAGKGSDVLDYRKAREAAMRRRGSGA